MITDADVTKLKKTFVTKEVLREALDQQKDDILDEVDIRLDNLKTEIVKDVAEAVADTFIPLFDKHDKRLGVLEKHTKHPPISTPVTA
jgi:hypothetical protein